MATFRNAVATTQAGGSASIAATKPTGVVSGDCMIALVNSDNDTSTFTATGWTALGSVQHVTNGDGQSSEVFWKVAGGSEPSTYTFTPSQILNDISVLIAAWSGTHATAPIGTSSVSNPNSASPPSSPVTITGTTVTTTAANQTVVIVGTVDWNADGTITFGGLGSFTSRLTSNPTTQATNGIIADQVKAVAGATGSLTVTETFAGKTGNYVSWLIPLVDAVSTGAITGTSALSFGSNASLAGSGSLGGTSALAFGQNGALGGSGALAGTSGLSFDSSGSLAGLGTLSGSTGLVFGSSGTLTGAGALAGSCAMVFGGSGTLTQPSSGALTGLASLVFGSSAALTGTGSLTGVSAILLGSSGTLLGTGSLIGSSALLFGQSGAILGSGSLSGSFLITFSQLGSLAGTGSLSGTSTLTFGQTGTLSGGPGGATMRVWIGRGSIATSATGTITFIK